VFEVAPSTAFGFGKGELSQTRRRFERIPDEKQMRQTVRRRRAEFRRP
jgi:hypothetical protein